MGSGGSSTPRSLKSSPAQPQVVMDVSQAISANNDVFSDTDSADFHNLYNGRNYFLSQTFNIETQMAIMDYLNDAPIPGSMYSASQDLNYAMESGQELNANQQFMVDSLNDGMHNLGYNVNLTRYGRTGYLDSFGKLFKNGVNSSNYENMTDAQLKKAFVGKTYTEDKFVSTSYNDFKTAPSSNAFTDKAVRFNIKAPAKTQALMPGNGPGGSLGEIVLKPGQTFKITGVRFTGKQGRTGFNYSKQIEFDVEIL